MDQAVKTAILLGATGLTGGRLLENLLSDTRYGRIRVFSRSPLDISHPKLEVHKGDLLKLSEFRLSFKADEVFCCIGTTKARTPDKEKYRAIDYGIPVAAAQLCRENGIETFLVISALGADPRSRVFYNRTKGEMEKAVLNRGIKRIFILQPALISGQRDESRPGEWIAKQLFKVLDLLLIGPLKKYRSIKAEEIARAMIWLANNDYEFKRIESDTIKSLANA
ncbi:Uncharacterized conserved protein YbjT, contains NAD(P)-binding and DUF2867 domains [Muriicola jejuensis]|uniref:NAD(P)H-binding protein n=1 Tax=Muriicola jejuensis TaxID=504488 RepID=A0A6P0UEF1_9FLAO|nr:NAD(P)H-binding protein [Muriicola jejuensis]NER10118.1 NAD(P)H-binding protein [Muriicola jejuensis]SMP02835.1 Uncharacterized conserved protein YbjT, contains NAD(P)-binding and DUF2867 domains [Muriicola jejuensis]